MSLASKASVENRLHVRFPYYHYYHYFPKVVFGTTGSDSVDVDCRWALSEEAMKQVTEFNGRVCEDIPQAPGNGTWLVFDDLNDLIHFKLKYL